MLNKGAIITRNYDIFSLLLIHLTISVLKKKIADNNSSLLTYVPTGEIPHLPVAEWALKFILSPRPGIQDSCITGPEPALCFLSHGFRLLLQPWLVLILSSTPGPLLALHQKDCTWNPSHSCQSAIALSWAQSSVCSQKEGPSRQDPMPSVKFWVWGSI